MGTPGVTNSTIDVSSHLTRFSHLHISITNSQLESLTSVSRPTRRSTLSYSYIKPCNAARYLDSSSLLRLILQFANVYLGGLTDTEFSKLQAIATQYQSVKAKNQDKGPTWTLYTIPVDPLKKHEGFLCVETTVPETTTIFKRWVSEYCT